MKTKVEVFEELIYKILKVKVELAETPDGDDEEMQNITTVEYGDHQHLAIDESRCYLKDNDDGRPTGTAPGSA